MIYRRMKARELRAPIVLPLLGLVVAGATACDGSGSGGPRRARPDQVPEQVGIEQGTTTYGFYTSRDRKPVDVAAFRVAKWPITVAQFKQCMDAGACSAATENACLGATEGGRDALAARDTREESNDRVPVTCVGIKQAQAYCEWVGGRLPTINQWLTAVRGREVARFAWGNTLPRCEQRPDVTRQPVGGAPCATSSVPSFAVGHHIAGASPFGVEDVLLASGELIAPSPDSPVSSCAAPFEACVAYGTRPGAIDSVAPLDGVTSEHGERSPHAYGFRCAFPGEKK